MFSPVSPQAHAITALIVAIEPYAIVPAPVVVDSSS